MRRILIHGAGGSSRSFNWLEAELALRLGGAGDCLTHRLDEPAEEVVARLRVLLDRADGPVCLIGHSLGGLIARAGADHEAVHRLVTLSAPFGGVPLADLMRWFSLAPLFASIRPLGDFIRRVAETKPRSGHLAFVTTHGLPHFREANDGVITVASQRHLPDPSYVEVPLNHFEVLLDPAVAERCVLFIGAEAEVS